jgi:hypothetical protein
LVALLLLLLAGGALGLYGCCCALRNWKFPDGLF